MRNPGDSAVVGFCGTRLTRRPRTFWSSRRDSVREVAPAEMDRARADPAARPLEPEQRERGRRLAAAGLADEPERLAARELERRVVDDVVPAVVRPEVDRQALDLDERLLRRTRLPSGT